MKIQEIFTKQDESDFIRESWQSEKLSADEYLELLTAHHLTQKLINESLNVDLMKEIDHMISVYGDNNPIIGKKYIPVQIVALNDSIMFYDVYNHNPPEQQAKFFTLQSVKNDYYTFLDNGKKIIYPSKKFKKVAYINTLLIASPENYRGLQHYAALVFEKTLPDLEADSIDETMLGDKPKRNPKYLSGTDRVAKISPVLGSNKPKKQKKLMNKFFGSS